MSYVPSFKNDVFVTYCHDDDDSLGDKGGWVSDFHEGLKRRLKQILGSRRIEVFLDKERLSGVSSLDDTIRAELDAATLMAVVSPLYLTSPYCREEREWFLEKSGESPRVGNMTRALRVVKTPSRNDAHRRVFDDGLGFEFCRVLGKDPFRFEEFRLSSQEFADEHEKLCQSVARLLETMWRKRSPVYLAQCSKALKSDYEKLFQELTDQGFRVLPEIELDDSNVEYIAKEGIDEAEISIHLLDSDPDDLALRQAQMTMEMQQPAVTWFQGDRPDEKSEYAELLGRLIAHQDSARRSQFLERTRLERVKAEVLGLLRPFEAPEKRETTGTRQVYILCHPEVRSDYQSARKIRNWIVEKERFEVELPETAPLDPSELRQLHETKLGNADGVLLYWGEADLGWFNTTNGVSTCLDHTLHVVVGPRTPSHEPPVRHRIDLYGVLKQAVEQQSTRP